MEPPAKDENKYHSSKKSRLLGKDTVSKQHLQVKFTN
jgi:hypothetical protein